MLALSKLSAFRPFILELSSSAAFAMTKKFIVKFCEFFYCFEAGCGLGESLELGVITKGGSGSNALTFSPFVHGTTACLRYSILHSGYFHSF